MLFLFNENVFKKNRYFVVKLNRDCGDESEHPVNNKQVFFFNTQQNHSL